MLHLSANNMSSRPKAGPPSNEDDDTGVVVETRAKTKRPPLYKVMLLNDDYTPMEFVVHGPGAVLRNGSWSRRLRDHAATSTSTASGDCWGIFIYEIAETKVAQVMDFARRHQHPLQCTMEKE